MIQEFKAFVMKGNVLDLAVAVVIGAAFNAVVTSMVDNLLNPIAGAIFGKPDFSDVTLTLREGSGDEADSVLFIGTFITDVINFVIIAFSVFLVVKSFETLQRARKAETDVEAAPVGPTELDLLMEIRDELKARP